MSIEKDGAEPATAANTNSEPDPGPSSGETSSSDARIIKFTRSPEGGVVRIDVPRLNISDDTERNTFICALIGGASVIWFGEYFDFVNAQLALFVAAVCIVSYSFVCYAGRERRVRLDRAGDNCYYLGLTYTLVSLSVALVKREVGTSPEALIQTFGIAVGSTIIGVIARLLLIQYRLEPDDIETRARVELATAADELRRQLIDAASRFQTFSVSIQDSVTVAVTKITNDQIDRQKELVAQINDVLAKSIEGIAQSTTVIQASLEQHSKIMKKYQTAGEKSASAAEMLASKIEALALPDDLISRGFTTLQTSLQGTASRLDGATQAMTASTRELGQAAINLSQLGAQSSHVSSAMESSLKALAGLRTAVEGMTTTLSAETSKLAAGNSSLDDELSRMRQLTLDYARGLSDVAQFLAKEIGRAGA